MCILASLFCLGTPQPSQSLHVLRRRFCLPATNPSRFSSPIGRNHPLCRRDLAVASQTASSIPQLSARTYKKMSCLDPRPCKSGSAVAGPRRLHSPRATMTSPSTTTSIKAISVSLTANSLIIPRPYRATLTNTSSAKFIRTSNSNTPRKPISQSALKITNSTTPTRI